MYYLVAGKKEAEKKNAKLFRTAPNWLLPPAERILLISAAKPTVCVCWHGKEVWDHGSCCRAAINVAKTSPDWGASVIANLCKSYFHSFSVIKKQTNKKRKENTATSTSGSPCVSFFTRCKPSRRHYAKESVRNGKMWEQYDWNILTQTSLSLSLSLSLLPSLSISLSVSLPATSAAPEPLNSHPLITRV